MRIEALTFFRFLAAIFIVFFHFGRGTELAKYGGKFINSGPQMVTFFFVLSGFVMMVSHYNKTRQTLRTYYVSRIARIVPVYMFALVCFVSLRGSDDVAALLLSITFLQSWFPPYPLSLNFPGWALSVQALFYISFPLVLFLVRSSQITPKRFAFISLMFYFFTQAILSNLIRPGLFYAGYPSASHDLINYFPLSHYCSFLLGVSGGYIYVNGEKYIDQSPTFSTVRLLAASYLTYYLLQNPLTLRHLVGFPLAYGSSFYALLFLLLILSVAFSKNLITKLLSLPFLVLLGESSYSIYILQKPVHIVYSRYIAPHLELSNDGHFYFYALTLICISIFTFRLIERPGQRIVLKINAYLLTKASNKAINADS